MIMCRYIFLTSPLSTYLNVRQFSMIGIKFGWRVGPVNKVIFRTCAFRSVEDNSHICSLFVWVYYCMVCGPKPSVSGNCDLSGSNTTYRPSPDRVVAAL